MLIETTFDVVDENNNGCSVSLRRKKRKTIYSSKYQYYYYWKFEIVSNFAIYERKRNEK